MSQDWINRVLDDLIRDQPEGVDVNLIREVNDFLRKEDGFADKVITSVDRDTGEMIILNYGKHTR
jgi:hypothetical protein